jgi:hypothetical protein
MLEVICHRIYWRMNVFVLLILGMSPKMMYEKQFKPGMLNKLEEMYPA